MREQGRPSSSASAHSDSDWAKLPSCPDPAMNTRLLCWAALCLLGGACTDAGIIQSPKHEVTEMGQAVTLRCEPILGHNLLYWYRQTLVQGLELLSYFRSRSIIDDEQMPKDRFSAERPDGSFSTLKIQPAEQGDSAVYICASRLATALQNRPLPVQKPWCFLFSPQLPAVLSKVFPAPPSSQEYLSGFGAQQRQKMVQF
uniref:Ig-like domain-containing protein n=1 Tax=Callithrix jacchus TaxID=9483 RepID=A0A5F4VRY3_CALJA